MKPEEIVRVEAAVEMRDLAVRAIRECVALFGPGTWEERRVMKAVVELAATRVQRLRLPTMVVADAAPPLRPLADDITEPKGTP